MGRVLKKDDLVKYLGKQYNYCIVEKVAIFFYCDGACHWWTHTVQM